VKIVLAGRHGIGCRVLDHLVEQRHDVQAVITPAADVEAAWQPSLAEAARVHGIPVLTTNINAAAGDLRALAPDVIFSVQHPDRFKRDVLALPPRGCINLHFGRLPDYAGCYPIIWPILNGDTHAGATLHYMDEGFDSGAVIGIVAVPIDPMDTGRRLYDRVADAGMELFRRELPAFAAGRVDARPQVPGAGHYYPKGSIDFDRDRLIDWRQPPQNIHDRIRALTFPPFQVPAIRTGAALLEIWDSTIVESPGQTGTVLGTRDGRLMIGAGPATIGIRHVRRPGGATLEPDAVLLQGLLAIGQQLA
jgi:methionyl-tRNA formyltransferase